MIKKRSSYILLILGIIIYFTSFVWTSPIGMVLTLLGGLLISLSLLSFGLKIKTGKKIIGVILIVFSSLLLVIIVFIFIGLLNTSLI